ncbi:MAG TPA: hypothetical protein VGO51_12160 [Burkholderiaceae bacterium]|jgi:hypothetical protein|nr:hypothetical protein [Burkholderiaceae bacterium]
MKKILLPALFAAALAAPLVVQAANNDTGLHFVLSGGLTFGGDTIYTANYTNGTSVDITGGGLVQLGAGALWQYDTIPLALSFTANYHVDNTTATNGEAKFSRMPYEAIAYYTGVDRWRFGVGLRSVHSAKSTAEINGARTTTTYKNTTGAVIEAGFGITQNSWINVRYVSEKYQPDRFTATNGQTITVINGKSVDGSHIGVNFLYKF